MKDKKLFVLIVSVLMALIIPIIIYGFNFNSVAFDKDLYKKEFLKYNVYSNLKNHDIENINNDILDYLSNLNKNELIENDFFNGREKMHLLDVKKLINKIFIIYYLSVILFLLSFILLIISMNFNFKKIIKNFLIILSIGSTLTLVGAILSNISSNLNFDFVFTSFHETFFSLGTYTFNPEFEKIVILYPENLFFDFLIMVTTNTITSSIILLLLCITFLFILFKLDFRKFFKKNIDGEDNK